MELPGDWGDDLDLTDDERKAREEEIKSITAGQYCGTRKLVCGESQSSHLPFVETIIMALTGVEWS